MLREGPGTHLQRFETSYSRITTFMNVYHSKCLKSALSHYYRPIRAQCESASLSEDQFFFLKSGSRSFTWAFITEFEWQHERGFTMVVVTRPGRNRRAWGGGGGGGGGMPFTTELTHMSLWFGKCMDIDVLTAGRCLDAALRWCQPEQK